MTPQNIQKFALGFVFLFFMGGGIGHFVMDDFFIAIVPDYLPAHAELVYISGVFEILGALGLLLPTTRQLAGWGLMALTLAVFPANIYMAMNPELFSQFPVIGLYLRLPLQLVILWLIWQASRYQREPLAAAA